MSDIVDEMVLAIAHAICKSRTFEGVDCCQWPANRGRTKCPINAGGYDDAARDAIEAMRVNEWAAQAATEIKSLRAQVEQAWQPIETAPKDGRSILLCDARRKDYQAVAGWDDSTSTVFTWETGDSSYHKDTFTHWREMPAPPSDDRK